MRFLKRIAGFLGLARDEAHELHDEQDDDHHHRNHTDEANRNRPHIRETGLPRKGFSVPVQVAVERSHLPPLLAPSDSGDGGIQGLKWYTKRLRVDEDGDVADEFFDEIDPAPASNGADEKPFPKFQLKYSTKLARVKKQAISPDGRFLLCVEHQGRLQWV